MRIEQVNEDIGAFSKRVLSNGLSILTYKIPEATSASIYVYAKVGSRHEDKREAGISHFLEHMAFKGTFKRTAIQINKELDILGGYNNAFTGHDKTAYISSFVKEDFKKALELLADITINSRLDKEDVDQERKVILEELNMSEDNPSQKVAINAYANTFKDNPMARPILGFKETLRNITSRELIAFKDRYYNPSNMFVAISGDIDINEVESLCEEYFEFPRLQKSEGAKEIVTPNFKFEYFPEERNIQDIYGIVSMKAPIKDKSGGQALNLMNTILGAGFNSKLWRKIREEKGHAYSVMSYLNAYKDFGILFTQFSTRPENFKTVLEDIDDIIKTFVDTVTQEELDIAKRYEIIPIKMNILQPDFHAARLGNWYTHHSNYIDLLDIMKKFEKISLDEVKAKAEEFLSGVECSITALGPISKVK